jgi:hypothetical protein
LVGTRERSRGGRLTSRRHAAHQRRTRIYQRRIDRARRATHLLRQLHALGYQVQLTDAAA